MSKAKRKIPREKPWDVYAYKYMEHNDGNVGECDLAIAFRAGVRFVQDRLFISCKKEAPRAEINKQIIMLEYYGGCIRYIRDICERVQGIYKYPPLLRGVDDTCSPHTEKGRRKYK